MKTIKNTQQNIAKPSTKSQAMNLAAGAHFECFGKIVRLERAYDNGVVELLDTQTLSLQQVKNPDTGELSAPTVDWMCQAYGEGQLHLIGSLENATQRQARFALYDPDACAARDPKSPWRFTLAWKASAAGIPKTDRDYNAWLDINYGRNAEDKNYRRPSASTLRRWVRSIENGDKRVGRLVSQAGRARGRSQLEPVVDNLLTEAALMYWSSKRGKMVHAQAWLATTIYELNAALPDADGRTEPYVVPSKESLRKRINRLQCHDTVAAKFGKSHADKQFKASGEPMHVDHILQVALMDATTLEQVIVFDENWRLPACKVRITPLLDASSHAILGFSLYAGPNRHETSVEAILSCMQPTDYSPEALEFCPDLRYVFGRPSAILPDNEKALIGPSSLPGLNEAGITLLLPPIEMPTAKAVIERFFRTLKEELAQLPGTVIDPKRAKDLDYDAVGSASLTLHQLRAIVTQVIAKYNTTPSKGLDNRSPVDVWMEQARRRATPAFENIDDVRRILGRTYDAILTRDGVELDGIRYRDATKVKSLLDNLANTTAFRSRRRDGSATVKVKARRNDGNLDVIYIHDSLTNEFVALPSTQPIYTDKLTAWEHHQFRNAASRRHERFQTEDQRLKSIALTLKEIDKVAPTLAFQKRSTMAALYQSAQVKRLCPRAPVPFPSDAIIAPQSTSELLRNDDGLPPEAKPPKRETRPSFPAPDRPEGYGGDAMEKVVDDFDWDTIDTTDPETGREPPAGPSDPDLDFWDDAA
jgi:hypothetical protein